MKKNLENKINGCTFAQNNYQTKKVINHYSKKIIWQLL